MYKIAKKLHFSDFLNLGKSERTNKDWVGQAILADSVEAVIAAIYLDGDLKEAEKFILSNLKEEIEDASKNVGMKDYKTILQEKMQENGEVKIEYEIIGEEGPDHNKIFTARVKVNGEILQSRNRKK